MNAPHIPQQFLLKALDVAEEGIMIIDASRHDFPLLYVNPGFEHLTGYAAIEVIGKNFRTFQASDSRQPELTQIHDALASGKECTTTLRNSRKDGTLYWNQLSLTPVQDAQGTLTHFIGIQKDVTTRIQLEQQLNEQANTDSVTGIGNRRHFDERYADLLAIAKRIRCEVSVVLVELDFFQQFNQNYGFSAGNECLRKVAECIAQSFVRTSDCVARYGGKEFAVVAFSSNRDGLYRHCQRLCEKVRELNIAHRDSLHKFVTISIGGIQRLPGNRETPEQLIDLATQKLQVSLGSGGNCVNI